MGIETRPAGKMMEMWSIYKEMGTSDGVRMLMWPVGI